jgi:hypothetical protein
MAISPLVLGLLSASLGRVRALRLHLVPNSRLAVRQIDNG